MHWRALHHHDVADIGPDGFADIDWKDIKHFAVVEPLGHGCVVVWEANGIPLNYARRETPGEVIHVFEMPTEKVFIFDGTGTVIRQPQWGSGVFSAIGGQSDG